ncbi:MULTISPECIES: 5'/3'-nucleotidase SurE [Halorubrum]|jgi:5'-nucleotidase|uniref:5'-nucleotidase SurE n=1 Tax=Halorubrum tropicale TaxID=1765655 RepID=A0A0N0UB18_9EURY|nr:MULTISPECIES: 5'/3'-nucleotidase SurE [Halorubrum]KOX97903.1 stationary-phase survival protein SurE [Halorubrum tropicale]RLM50445.1 5'/3'-nucleotidase SurE [Halorubrum sp. Atlit-28R]TKX42977.1 5'/3'-nucleotidase SurE [Halorubrum sp. ARQ200]TKX50477.1 5'/3'-nucleotidase SurE [Halorubrum sp. ASP121]TKX62335.1 5'/3'-nucleotidase SurE [Halorubrum sp. ASP1]
MPTEILLTNDDGIDAVGLRALADALSRDYDVTVVAPATNQSGVGGARSWWDTTVDYTETDRGYAVEGTPADCVAVADVALELDPDVVVSGCNHGPNIGAHILGQSGTVGAAMEASFLGTPAVAVSLYDRGNLPVPPTLDNGDFAVAGSVVADLIDRAAVGSDGGLELPFGADVLNVNVPAADDEAAENPTYRLTEPARGFDVIEFRPGEEGPEEEDVPEGWEFGERRGEMGMELRDRFWREFLRGNVPDDPGSDRRAAVEGEVSISPLSSSRSVAGERTGELVDPAPGAETGAD